MTLPDDDEAAKFVTPGWLKRVAEVPIEEVPAMVLEDPSVVTALVGALRHERKVSAARKSQLERALVVADALVLELAGSGATPRKLDLLDEIEAVRTEAGRS